MICCDGKAGGRALLVACALAACILAGVTVSNQTMPAETQPTGGLTDVEGIRVGHHTLAERPTGCTVVLVDGEGAVGGVSQRGGAPGTRETDLLDPLNLVDKVNAIVLAGGSAYGLDAAQGVVRFLEERKIGWKVGDAGVVPIVPAAILLDLWFGGDPAIRPTADCGYRAALAASSGALAEGNVGAGAGATIGKLAGRSRAMKGGIGTASIRLPDGLVVAALAAVNAVGDVVDPSSGRVVAGVRTEDGKQLADARRLLRTGGLSGRPQPLPGGNTTLGVVATNARLTKSEITRIALMADDGFARALYPAHTVGDGDTVFALATGAWPGEPNVTTIGALAADVMAEAIVRGAARAATLGGLPAAIDLGTSPARVR